MKNVMAFSKHLYLGNGINDADLKKIQKQLQKKPMNSQLFLICISTNTYDHLDIFEALQLDQTYYRKTPPRVVGIANNKNEALQLVEDIVKECLENTGSLNLKEYLNVNFG